MRGILELCFWAGGRLGASVDAANHRGATLVYMGGEMRYIERLQPATANMIEVGRSDG